MTDKDEIARLKDLFGRFAVPLWDAEPREFLFRYNGAITEAEAQEIIGYAKARREKVMSGV